MNTNRHEEVTPLQKNNNIPVKDMTLNELNENIDLMAELYDDIQELLKNPLLVSSTELLKVVDTLDINKIQTAQKTADSLEAIVTEAHVLLTETRQALKANMFYVSNFKKQEEKRKIAFNNELMNGKKYLEKTILESRIRTIAVIVLPILNLSGLVYLFYNYTNILG